MLPRKAPDVSFPGTDVIALRQPMVYIWRRGDELLYVGLGTKGVQRPLASDHHVLLDIEPSDRLDIFFCETDIQAVDLEKKWIRQLKPKLNQVNAGPHSAFGMRPTTIAEKLQIPTKSVIAACEKGELPATAKGDSWRIRLDAATRWAKDRDREKSAQSFVGISTAVEEYDLDEDDLRTWIRKGILPHYRLGPEPGLIRILRDDLVRAVQSPWVNMDKLPQTTQS